MPPAQIILHAVQPFLKIYLPFTEKELRDHIYRNTELGRILAYFNTVRTPLIFS